MHPAPNGISAAHPGERRPLLLAPDYPLRRIVLVDMPWARDKDPRHSLGHASLVAALRARARVELRTVVAPVRQGPLSFEALVEEILGLVRDLPPDRVDVAFGAYVWNEELLQAVLTAVRRRGFRGRTILGGPQISYAGPGLERVYPQVDAFVRGFGEDALCRLAGFPGRSTIRGVHYRGEPDLVEQTEVELASLPSPWLGRPELLRGQRFIRWETQRGCPYSCTFCQHREPGQRSDFSDLLLERVLAEIDLFCDAGVEEIAVLDPVFNVGPNWRQVLERFRDRGFRGRLSLQCRAELIDDEFLDALAGLNVHVELGLQTIHEAEGTAIHRRNNLAKVDRVLSELRKRGIDHEVSLIFGLPLQTLASFFESVRWCLDRAVPVIKAFPLMLLRGTELEVNREKWNIEASPGPMSEALSSSTYSPADRHVMAQLSEALRATEGAHPPFEKLLELARTLTPDAGRFRSSTVKEVIP